MRPRATRHPAFAVCPLVAAQTVETQPARAQTPAFPDVDAMQDTGFDLLCAEIVCPVEGRPLRGQDTQHERRPASCTDEGFGSVSNTVTGFAWHMTPPSQRPHFAQARASCEALDRSKLQTPDTPLPPRSNPTSPRSSTTPKRPQPSRLRRDGAFLGARTPSSRGWRSRAHVLFGAAVGHRRPGGGPLFSQGMCPARVLDDGPSDDLAPEDGLLRPSVTFVACLRFRFRWRG